MNAKDDLLADKPLLTTPKAAQFLKVTEYHVREGIKRGQIEAVRIGKRDFVVATGLRKMVGAA